MIFRIFKKKPATPPPVIDWVDLRLQCINNIIYLKSHIRVLDATIEDLKNRSARSSRARIESLTRTKKWMSGKLVEEEVMAARYAEKINSAPILSVQE